MSHNLLITLAVKIKNSLNAGSINLSYKLMQKFTDKVQWIFDNSEYVEFYSARESGFSIYDSSTVSCLKHYPPRYYLENPIILTAIYFIEIHHSYSSILYHPEMRKWRRLIQTITDLPYDNERADLGI